MVTASPPRKFHSDKFISERLDQYHKAATKNQETTQGLLETGGKAKVSTSPITKPSGCTPSAKGSAPEKLWFDSR